MWPAGLLCGLLALAASLCRAPSPPLGCAGRLWVFGGSKGALTCSESGLEETGGHQGPVRLPDWGRAACSPGLAPGPWEAAVLRRCDSAQPPWDSEGLPPTSSRRGTEGLGSQEGVSSGPGHLRGLRGYCCSCVLWLQGRAGLVLAGLIWGLGVRGHWWPLGRILTHMRVWSGHKSRTCE